MRWAGLLFLMGCSQVAEPVQIECDPPEPVEIKLPADCWVDDAMCPPITGTPWEECSRRYACESPDGSPWCVHAMDCACLGSFNAGCDDAQRVELPSFCEYVL